MAVCCPDAFSLLNLSSVQFINSFACYEEFHLLKIGGF